jgi:hypothetical protein
MEKEKCWGEQEGIQGCAACDLREDWIKFLKGEGLNKQCRPKQERLLGKKSVDDLAAGKAQFDPGPALRGDWFSFLG